MALTRSRAYNVTTVVNVIGFEGTWTKQVTYRIEWKINIFAALGSLVQCEK